ncbi:MAG: MFS transporter [candidate division Zixibacteria bacterium]|nr:MFS transporter [candidate division Zixibacteria bacterium]
MEELKLNKKTIFSWGIYDFANTIFSMNIISMYFAQWIIVDHHKEDIWYSLTYSLSMLLVALTIPVLGAISDGRGKRKPYLLILTLGCVLATLFIGGISSRIANANLLVFSALFFFLVANYCFEGGLVFYNAMLPEISTPKNIGRVSGFGVALGYAGSIIGLLLVKPFVTGNFFGLQFGSGGREKAFIPTAFFFLLFSLPIFLFVKEKGNQNSGEKRIKIKEAFRKVWNGIIDTKKYPGVLRFLIADYFFEDAIATVIIFMAVYAQVVMNMGDEAKIFFFWFATTFAILGSFVSGVLSDRIGPKKTLFFVVSGWILSLSVIMLSTRQLYFWIMGPLIGICLGSTWTASRPLLATLAPRNMLGQFYGLYSLSGRAAATIGPLLWGGAVLFLKKDNPLVKGIINLLERIGFTFSDKVLDTIQYRFGILFLVLLMIIGLLIFIKVPDKKMEDYELVSR